MQSREQIETIVRDLYAARVRGDVDGLVRPFTQDGWLQIAGFPGEAEPGGKQVADKAQLREGLENLVREFDFLQQDIVTSVIEGDRAAIHSRVRVRHSASGVTEDTDILDLFTFEDGRIASLLEFCDTALAVRLQAGVPEMA